MDETVDNTVDDNEAYDSVRKLKLIRLKAKAAAFAAGIIPVGTVVPNIAVHNPSPARAELSAQKLKDPEHLPGSHIEVKPETIQKLASSESLLLIGSKKHKLFTKNGTAVSILLNNKHRWLASLHTEEGWTAGLASNESTKDGTINIPGKTALDFNNPALEDVAIGDHYLPNGHDSTATSPPMLYVTGMSGSTKDMDQALLKGTPRSGSHYSEFLKHGNYIDYTHQPELADQLLPGQQVALGGYTKVSGYRLVVRTGTYLGRIWMPNNDHSTRQIDWIGVKAQSPEMDPCADGASGSVFTADVPDGMFASGSLSLRINYKTDPLQPNSRYTKQQELDSWQYVQKITGVDMSSFTSVCGYSVVGNSLPGLEKGFGHSAYATSTPVRKH